MREPSSEQPAPTRAAPHTDIHELRNAVGSTLLSLEAARQALRMGDLQGASMWLDEAHAACDQCRRLFVDGDELPGPDGSPDDGPDCAAR